MFFLYMTSMSDQLIKSLCGYYADINNYTCHEQKHSKRKNEPPRDKTIKMACAPSEDSDQPGHPPSLIRGFAFAQWVAKNPSCLHADSEDSDQTGRMPRLIWVFAGRTCHFIGFVMRWLKWSLNQSVPALPVISKLTRSVILRLDCCMKNKL